MNRRMDDPNDSTSPCLCEERLQKQEPLSIPHIRYMRHLLEEHGLRIERLEGRIQEFIELVKKIPP